MYLETICITVGIYAIYRLLLLIKSVLNVTSGILYRLYNPPNFPISYFVFGNSFLSLFTYPVEYVIWILYRVVCFVLLVPYQLLLFAFAVASFYGKIMLSALLLQVTFVLVFLYFNPDFVPFLVPEQFQHLFVKADF